MALFNGKVVLVTGAGQGIGFEIVRQFLHQGAIVYMNDIDKDLCATAAQRLEHHERLHPAAGDASDLQFIERLLGNIIEKSRRIDVVVANAGTTLFKNTLQITPDEFGRIVDLNIKGTFFLLQMAANIMIQHKIQGKLIVMSSITGRRAHKDLAVYGMTKAALEGLVRNLVLDLSEFGITINAIAPGATITERTTQDENYKEIWASLTPLKRPSATNDIAQAALFLTSEGARQITGQTMVVDGGWSASSPGPPIS